MKHVNCHELRKKKKQSDKNIVCMLLISNAMISCAILDQMSTWNFSKTTNWTRYTRGFFLVFEKITCAHLHYSKFHSKLYDYLYIHVYLIDWARGPYGGILVEFSLGEVHTHVKRERDQYSPIRTKCEVNKWYIIWL